MVERVLENVFIYWAVVEEFKLKEILYVTAFLQTIPTRKYNYINLLSKTYHWSKYIAKNLTVLMWYHP